MEICPSLLLSMLLHIGLLYASVSLALPQIHHSVKDALAKRPRGANSKPSSLLVTFRPADFHAAEDPAALLHETRKHMPFLLAIDEDTFARNEELYHRYRGEYVLSAVQAQHKLDEVLESCDLTCVDNFERCWRRDYRVLSREQLFCDQG